MAIKTTILRFRIPSEFGATGNRMIFVAITIVKWVILHQSVG